MGKKKGAVATTALGRPLESKRARPSQAAPSYGRRSVCKGLTALLVNLACLSGS